MMDDDQTSFRVCEPDDLMPEDPEEIRDAQAEKRMIDAHYGPQSFSDVLTRGNMNVRPKVNHGR
jgi:hypothetical protein